MQKAETADASSRELVEMSRAVGAIADLIEKIAGQTNLLALNATIESARAGEAGKGFAVVANEVKNLATQTAKATDQIRQQLDGVQKTAVSVADILGSVKESIGKVSESSSTIAAAVEQQSVATQEIVSNMSTATVGVEQINKGIFSIKNGTESTSASTSQVLDAAKMLSEHAERMDTEVKTFLKNIQNA
jgi:methyl-accepting chemotaxis protein